MKITKPMKLIRDNKDNSIFNALDFGGPKIYKVNDNIGVYAPEGGTNITYTKTEYTLEPLGLKIPRETEGEWEIISHQNIGTCDWRITVKNTITGEEHSGVYPFKLNGHVYQLECGGEWVMASCGGYKLYPGDGKPICYTLLGTGEIIELFGTVMSLGKKLAYRITPDIYGCGIGSPNYYGTITLNVSIDHSRLEQSASISVTIPNVPYWRGQNGSYVVNFIQIVNYLNTGVCDSLNRFKNIPLSDRWHPSTKKWAIFDNIGGAYSSCVGSFQRIYYSTLMYGAEFSKSLTSIQQMAVLQKIRDEDIPYGVHMYFN